MFSVTSRARFYLFSLKTLIFHRKIVPLLEYLFFMKFTLQHKAPNSKARAALIETDHGPIQTPIFMPVGTAAAMKGIFHRDVKEDAHAQIILANTYHLYLRPGMDRCSPTAVAFRSSRLPTAVS